MKLYFDLFLLWQIMVAFPIVIIITDCFWLCWQFFCFVFIRYPSKSVCEAHWCDKTWYLLRRNEYNCVVSQNRIRAFELADTFWGFRARKSVSGLIFIVRVGFSRFPMSGGVSQHYFIKIKSQEPSGITLRAISSSKWWIFRQQIERCETVYPKML